MYLLCIYHMVVVLLGMSRLRVNADDVGLEWYELKLRVELLAILICGIAESVLIYREQCLERRMSPKNL